MHPLQLHRPHHQPLHQRLRQVRRQRHQPETPTKPTTRTWLTTTANQVGELDGEYPYKTKEYRPETRESPGVSGTSVDHYVFLDIPKNQCAGAPLDDCICDGGTPALRT